MMCWAPAVVGFMSWSDPPSLKELSGLVQLGTARNHVHQLLRHHSIEKARSGVHKGRGKREEVHISFYSGCYLMPAWVGEVQFDA